MIWNFGVLDLDIVLPLLLVNLMMESPKEASNVGTTKLFAHITNSSKKQYVCRLCTLLQNYN